MLPKLSLSEFLIRTVLTHLHTQYTLSLSLKHTYANIHFVKRELKFEMQLIWQLLQLLLLLLLSGRGNTQKNLLQIDSVAKVVNPFFIVVIINRHLSILLTTTKGENKRKSNWTVSTDFWYVEQGFLRPLLAQSGSRIWTNLIWLNLAMVVFATVLLPQKNDAWFKSGQK